MPTSVSGNSRFSTRCTRFPKSIGVKWWSFCTTSRQKTTGKTVEISQKSWTITELLVSHLRPSATRFWRRKPHSPNKTIATILNLRALKPSVRKISMSMTRIPKRGEIWLVDFEPSFGAEIRKIRPAVVLSLDQLARLPLRVVVPLTEWKPQYQQYSWFVRIPMSSSKRLGQGVWCRRFPSQIGIRNSLRSLPGHSQPD